MAEFTEVCKAYKRMCNMFNDCSKCPMRKVIDHICTCRFWTLMENPETAEEVIMKWAKENPLVTNRDKFIEAFGFDPVSMSLWNDKGAEWLKAKNTRSLNMSDVKQSRIEKILSGKTPEEQYDTLYWLMMEYGKGYSNSRLARIEWLKGEKGQDGTV